MENKGEIILYQPDNEVRLEVRLEDETVWLNRQQLSVLFDRDIKTIGKNWPEFQLSQILRQLPQTEKPTKWNITIWI